jgi:hypothetical protein
MQGNPDFAGTRAERADRIKSAHKTTRGYEKTSNPEAKRHGIGGNGAPAYDPEAPVTGFPYYAGDIKPVTLPCGTEITSRSQQRAYEKANGVEFCGHEWTASSDVGKPHWYDEFAAHRRANDKRMARGLPMRRFKCPPKPAEKQERLAVGVGRISYAKDVKRLGATS